MPTVFQPDSPELKALIEQLGDLDKATWPLYKQTVRHAMECAAHGVPDPNAQNPIIKTWLDKARPNEAEEVKCHRLDNFTQITLRPWERTVNSLKRIFNPKLRTVFFPEWPSSNISPLQDYLMDLPYKLGSLEFYMMDVVLDDTLRDANGVVAIIPKEDSLGEPDAFIEPVPFIFGSDQVIDKKKGEWYLLLTYRKSNIGTDESPRMEGLVFYLIDSRYIWEIRQVPNSNNNKAFSIGDGPVLEHNLGEPPVVPMVGKSEGKSGMAYKLSYLAGALPDWKSALIDESDLEAVKLRHKHPKYWQLKIACPECKGRSVTSGPYRGEMKCGTCNGNPLYGTTDSPAAQLTIDPKKLEDWSGPPGDYINPDPAVLTWMRKEIEGKIQGGLAAINMQDTSMDSRAGESGEAKRVDKQEQHTFFRNVAIGIYSMWYNIARFIAEMRYNSIPSIEVEAILPTIKPPKKFDLYSTNELAEKVSTLRNSGVSFPVISEAEKELIMKEFGDSPTSQKLLTILELDPLPGLGGDDMLVQQSNIREIDLRVHNNISRYVSELIEENENFINLSRQDQRGLVYEKAQNEIAPMTELIPGIPADPGSDVEAEARAKLKGTVGGVQGVLQIQQSVAEGVTQYDAGLSMLKEIYGYSDEVARRLLGTPIDLRDTTETVPEE